MSNASFSYQADDELERLPEDEGVAYISDYEGYFEDEDFDPLSLNPHTPTEAKPGSEDKVKMLAARYAAGLPLWHDSDCYDHGPEHIGDEEDEFEDALEFLED